MFGNWQGEGIAVHSQGDMPCESIYASISGDNNFVTINKVAWSCGNINFKSKPQTLTIIDGRLYRAGISEPLGRINENSMTISAVDGDRSYEVVIAISDGRAAFIKRVTSNKSGQSMAIGGSLTVVH